MGNRKQTAWAVSMVAVLLGAIPSQAQVTSPGRYEAVETAASSGSAALDGGSDDLCSCPPCDGDFGWNVCFSPRWTVAADGVFLTRRAPDAAVLIFNTADPAQNLNAAAFDFDTRLGIDVSLTRHGTCHGDLEVRYFGLDPWHEAATVPTTPGDLLQINTDTPLTPFAGTAIDASCESKLHNFEINGHRAMFQDRLGLLAGFRYLELDERFRATLADTGIPFAYDARTRNRLYGFQLGGRAAIWDCGGPWTIEGVGKAGVYFNQAAQGSLAPQGAVTISASDHSTPTAFVGEVGLTAGFRLTERLSFRGGYRLLWIDSVALATEQIAPTSFVDFRGIDASGDTFYHGAVVGIELLR